MSSKFYAVKVKVSYAGICINRLFYLIYQFILYSIFIRSLLEVNFDPKGFLDGFIIFIEAFANVVKILDLIFC